MQHVYYDYHGGGNNECSKQAPVLVDVNRVLVSNVHVVLIWHEYHLLSFVY